MSLEVNEAWVARQPYLNDNVVERLGKLVQPDFKVFEFGTGGSTIWFANRVAELVSVEHDPTWFEILSRGFVEDFGEVPAHVTLIMASPKTIRRGLSLNLKKWPIPEFAQRIRSFPNDYFDLILVDGHEPRGRCLLNSKDKVKVGGTIVLDDSQREDYLPAIKELSDWQVEKLTMKDHMRETMFFKRLV